MSDGILDAYDDEASAWTDAHTTLDHNGDEDDDGDAWVDEDESAPTSRAAIPRPPDAIRSAKQAAKTLAQRIASPSAPKTDPQARSAKTSQGLQHTPSVPEPAEPAVVDRWAGRAPPPHLARASNLGKTVRWGPNVTRRVKTIDDVEATELVEGEADVEPQAKELNQDDEVPAQGGNTLVDAFNATEDESAWDAPTGATQGLQPALTPRKVNFREEIDAQSAQPADNVAQEEHHESLDDTQGERPNDWGEPPYEVAEAPDNGSVLRLGDHWLEIEPPTGCRSWQIFFRRNPTLESLDRPEDEDDYYWYDDYYDDYAEYGQEGSSRPIEHPDASPILFVGGLPYTLTVDEIKEAFTPYGNILRVAIPKDPETGDSRGFGYVEFDSQDSAHSAMEALAGQELGGRTMRLDYALPRGHTNGDGGHTYRDSGHANHDDGHTIGDGDYTGAFQTHEHGSRTDNPWQPPPVSKSVTCTNTVALPFNRWGRKASESGGANEHNPVSQERPRDAKVNNWLQKQPRDSVDDDGWGPTDDVQASNDDGWGPTDDMQATSNDDGWGPTENVQSTKDDGWGPSENVQATDDDGWGPSEEPATPTGDQRKPNAAVQSSEDTQPTAAPEQPPLDVSADDGEDAVEIPATLKIDWPADTSGGWDDPVDTSLPTQARTHLEPLQAVRTVQPIRRTQPIQPTEPIQPVQPIQPSGPAEEPAVQITKQLEDKDDDRHESPTEDHDGNMNADNDDKNEEKDEDKNDEKDHKTDHVTEDNSETTTEDKNTTTRPANLPPRPQWTPTDTKSSRSTGLNQGIRAPTVPPSGDQILLKNFRSRGGPPAASLPIPRVVKALATRSSEPSTPATPTEVAIDPAAELQKLLEKTEAALQGFDAAKKTGKEVSAANRAADSGIMPLAKKASEPVEVQEKTPAPPVVEKVAPIEATLAAATPADNRIEALVQQFKAQRERLKAILEG